MPLLPSALPPKGEASRYGANNFLNLIALPQRGRWPEGLNNVMQWRRFYDLKGAHDAETTFEPDDEGTSVFHASEHDEGGVSSLVSFPTHVSGEVPEATGDGGFYL